MRLIAEIDDETDAREFSYFLLKEGIKNEIEANAADKKHVIYQVWVISEELIPSALEWYDEFKKDPKNPLFRGHHKEALKEVIRDQSQKRSQLPPKIVRLNRSTQRGHSGLTSFFLIACILIFFSKLFIPSPMESVKDVSLPVIFSSPLYKHLMYDYPKAYQLLEHLLIEYGMEELEHPENLPEEGRILEKKRLYMTYWDGAYDELLLSLREPDAKISFDAPMFEQIREGQVWRLFTPCLLHADIFHIFFNMFWLLVLGPSIERNVGKKRFLFFILLIGILSNSAQYLISGPNFLGFSGVIAGMLGFTWMRQKYYPWEDYHTNQGVFLILSIGIFIMLILQLVSFYLEVKGQPPIASGIANTAHIVGLIAGLLLGKMKAFAVKTER